MRKAHARILTLSFICIPRCKKENGRGDLHRCARLPELVRLLLLGLLIPYAYCALLPLTDLAASCALTLAVRRGAWYAGSR